MKKSISIVLIIVSGLIGLFVGFSLGFEDINDVSRLELQEVLREKEINQIRFLTECTSKINHKDEGGFFSVKYVNYLTGTIKNNANLAKAKDVKLAVVYYSKTKSKIGSEEITIYDWIQPNSQLDFKEKVSVPDNCESFDCMVLSIKAE